MCFVNANKDTHLVEVPDRLAARVPGDWSREGKRKGFERFDSPELAELRAERAAAEEARENALAGVLRGLVGKFCEEWPRWRRAAEAAANLDALSSLAAHAEELAATCPDACTGRRSRVARGRRRETVSPRGEAAHGREAAALPHAGPSSPTTPFRRGPGQARTRAAEGQVCVASGSGSAPFLLLTGPNMGGKSTLLAGQERARRIGRGCSSRSV